MTEEAEIEEALDQDYLFLTSFAETYYPFVVDKDKILCDQWLAKIYSEKVHGISQKRNRNIFFEYFLLKMQNGKLTGLFSKPPDDGPLPKTKNIFSPSESAESVTSDDHAVSGEEPEDFQERSADGRTYVAVRSLPNNQGTLAFVALNLDKQEDDLNDLTIIPCSVDRTKLRHIRALHRLANANSLGSHPSESQMEDFYLRNIETKVSGDVTQLYKTLNSHHGKTCGRDTTEIAYYDVLLNQIDEEIKGVVTGENELVQFLVSRLAQDLKKVPKMQHLFKLTQEQRHLKLLEILRQKLVVRQQEETRRNLLAEMEEKISAFGTRSECCMKGADEPMESMWQLAVTKPLSEVDMRKLSDTYPENLIATFLDLLADDRQVILTRGKRRQRKEIDSMRAEVYREVQSGKAEYNKARETFRHWNEILSVVEEMMYEAGNQMIEDDDESEAPRQNDHLLMQMIANVKETENLVVEEAQRAEILAAKIADANMWSFSLHEDTGLDSSWEIKSTMESTRREIETCKLLIDKQERRIEQLREQLEYE